MIDLGETVAQPQDRYGAALGSAIFVLLGVVTIPSAGRQLGVSYPVLSAVLGISIVMLLLAGVLLWSQARVTASVPLLVLAAFYAATALLMTPYLLLYHGLWPPLSAWIAASPQASLWLWFEWHLVFALSPIGYLLARRSAVRGDRAAFARVYPGATVTMIAVPMALAAPAIWIWDLPRALDHGALTPVSWGFVATIVTVSIVAIASLFGKNRFRSMLDVWLAITGLCMIADVTLTVSGAAPFTLGWYVSRIYIVIASSTVLIALLQQTGTVYAQLAKTADRLRDESLTDALTGLANRRSFDLRIAQVLADGVRLSRGAALLMIDVDNFKAFNDAHGHLGGDECLRDLAKTVNDCLSRTRDMVARYGGEEFAVIMADTDLRGALIVAERVRSSIEGMGIPTPRGAQYPAVTVSIGATAVESTAGVTADDFIEQADRALYRAKESGRNRTASWPLEEPALAPAVIPSTSTSLRTGSVEGQPQA
jgi:diguanylate cyclase (GGDEF)-like protein